MAAEAILELSEAAERELMRRGGAPGTRAKDRHQSAIVDAHEQFKRAEAEAWRQRNADYRAEHVEFPSLHRLLCSAPLLLASP